MITKWAEDLNRHFSKITYRWSIGHLKMFSITNHHGYAIQNHKQASPHTYEMTKARNNKCWWGCREKETLVHCYWECILVQPLWEIVWRFLKSYKENYQAIQQFHFWLESKEKKSINLKLYLLLLLLLLSHFSRFQLCATP